MRSLRRAGLIIAVVSACVSAAVLSYLQYRSLDELRSKTRVVVREQLRKSLADGATDVERELSVLAASILNRFEQADFDPGTRGGVGRKFTALLKDNPAVESLFLFSTCPCRGEHPFALYSDTGTTGFRRTEVLRDKQGKHIISSYRSARPVAASPQVLYFADNDTQRLYAFRTIAMPGQRSEDAFFAGLVISAASIREHLLPLIADRIGGAGDQLDLRLIPGRIDLSDDIAARFGTLLAGWSLSGDYRGPTIDTLARDQFLRGMLLNSAVLGIMLAAVLFIIRTAARETRLARLKSAFVSNVSHEMKTPVALIRLFAESLELGRITDEAKRREYLRVIRNECTRITRSIDNVLDFSKMEAHSKRYEFRPSDLAAALEEILGSYGDAISGAGFVLITDIARPLPLVNLDSNAFAQAVLNLLDNAVKYSRDIKEIRVRAYRDQAGVAVEVADRGIGIAKEEHERIFEKFYRVSTGLVHDTKGAGLGLSLTKHIVEAHGGRIGVESRLDQGSLFRITLPAVADAASITEACGIKGPSIAETAHR